MHKTQTQETENKLYVDITGLQAMLSIGKTSAMKIGKEAGAVTKVGKRVIYSVKRIEQYMDSLREG